MEPHQVPQEFVEQALHAYLNRGQFSSQHAYTMQLILAPVLTAFAEKVAFEIRRELVCCGIYDDMKQWRESGRELDEYPHFHDLCYWGEASAEIAEDCGAGER